MISKTLMLLASGAALAAANNFGDYPAAGSKVELANGENSPVILHQWDPLAEKKHLGPSQYHHHPAGPSQYHHQTNGGNEIHFPKPSDFKPEEKGHAAQPTLALTRGGNEGDNAGHPTLVHTPGKEGPTLSKGRHNPKMTSVPEGHPSKVPTHENGNGDHHAGPSNTWKPQAGPSQYHGHLGASQVHHKPGPSQYHHKAGKVHNHHDSLLPGNGGVHNHHEMPYKMTPPEEMHYNNGDNHDDNNNHNDKGRTNPKMHAGSDAKPYLPYVKDNNDVHNGKDYPVAMNHDNDNGSDHPVADKSQTDNHNGDDQEDKDSYKPPVWGPSASARARLAEKQKQDGMYALYGQAAADVCGMDEQMPGAEITACPLESGAGWDCLNLASTLESCGGCMSLSEGQDCTLIQGADTVGCVHGKCVIGSCEFGYYLDSDKGECVANSH